ncbi:ABC transporter substrate-binding protein [Terasakiella pusilla]|uniref:ABC transporter substrate-binding protein n=1 Tax=Terasakiella pusilla TaxID=64973 RepID=UPI00056EE811|nr:ABC transporter substrate-binding protein [Terasakiella pusilla]
MKNTFRIQASLVLVGLMLFGWVYSADAGPLEQKRPVRITFVTPEDKDARFWGIAHKFARTVAQNLDIDFKIVYNEGRHRFSYRNAIQAALQDPLRPDYIVGIFFRSTAVPFLDETQKAGIPVFIINTTTPAEDHHQIGQPRQNYPLFLGQMHPDEKQAGYDLGNYLIQKATSDYKHQTAEIIAISGHRENPVSNIRVDGLKQIAAETQSTFNRTIFSTWIPEDARNVTRKVAEKHQKTNVYWYASDLMAIKSAPEIPLNQKATVGGFDWNPQVVSAISQGTVDASIGGHFVELGLSLLLLYDHYNGYDFKDDTGVVIKTKMALLEKDNLATYSRFLSGENWETIDFKSFTKTQSGPDHTCDLSLPALITAEQNN